MFPNVFLNWTTYRNNSVVRVWLMVARYFRLTWTTWEFRLNDCTPITTLPIANNATQIQLCGNHKTQHGNTLEQ